MKQTYPQAISQIFESEGGYTNNPKDPGGPTDWGITLHDAQQFWNVNATAEDVKNMPKSVAESIYEQHYAVPVRYDDLPAGVDYTVLDYAVNSGVSRAIKVLQETVGVTADGQLGPVTLQAVLAKDPVTTINQIWLERLQFDKSLPTWDTFGAGWTTRCTTGRLLAQQLHAEYGIPGSTPTPTPTPVPTTSWLSSIFSSITSIFKRKT